MKNQNIFLFLCVVALLMSCEQPKATAPTEAQKTETLKGMIKVTIMYANGEGKTFDMDYYETKHMPMLADLFGETLKKIEIDKGIAGRTPDDTVPYLAIGYLYFDSLKDYQEAFAPHAEQIRGDIPNYTNIIPTIQISEVIQ